MEHYGIFGGTFDPIHRGHTELAAGVVNELNLTQLYFVPNHTPPLNKKALASASDRLAMIRLAVASQPKLVVDDREFQREGISYSVDTLQSFRKERGDAVSLCFMVGIDAFLCLPSWKTPPKISELAHFVIVNRPDAVAEYDALVQEVESVCKKYTVAKKLTDDPDVLRSKSFGEVYWSRVTPPSISATNIRERIASQQSVEGLLDDKVLTYIEDKQLYKHS